jgi:very-short-patch-repair endonuclease
MRFDERCCVRRFLPPLAGEVDRAKRETMGGVMRLTEGRSRSFARRLRKEMTEAEVVLWTYLRERKLNGFKFRRQHPVGPYVADFACLSARLIVEVDGATHSTPEELAHDDKRTEFWGAQGWRVLRVSNLDVFDNMDGVWRTIEHWLPPPAAARPPPPRAGEETGAPS